MNLFKPSDMNLKNTEYQFVVSNHSKLGKYKFEDEEFKLLTYKKLKISKKVFYRVTLNKNIRQKIKDKRYIKYNSKNLLNGALRGLKEGLFTYVTTVIDLGYKIEKLRNEEKLKNYLDKMSERLHYKSKFAREVEFFQMEAQD
jgi:hypothetical protein